MGPGGTVTISTGATVKSIHEKTAREFAGEVAETLGEYIYSIVLYGSVVRGEASDGSDIDVLVIGDGQPGIEDRVLDISYEIDLRNRTATSIFYSTPEDFERRLKLGSPFIEDMLNAGRVLHDNGTFERLREQMPTVGG